MGCNLAGFNLNSAMILTREGLIGIDGFPSDLLHNAIATHLDKFACQLIHNENHLTNLFTRSLVISLAPVSHQLENIANNNVGQRVLNHHFSLLF